MFSTLVVTCANAINNSVITVGTCFPIVVEGRLLGRISCAAVTKSDESHGQCYWQDSDRINRTSLSFGFMSSLKVSQ